MTALAEIRKDMLAVARLKGSDLSQFNEDHPRDEGGRFARVSTNTPIRDPRMERSARRRRRMRRGSVEGALQAAAAASLESTSAPSDRYVLQRLRIERKPLERRQIEREHKERVETKAKERAKSKGKSGKTLAPKVINANSSIDLNDPLQANPDEDYATHKTNGYVLVDPDHATELLGAKSFYVGAAERRWGVDLTIFDEKSLKEYAKTNDVSGKVALHVNNQFLSPEESMTPGGISLGKGQYVAVDVDELEDLADHGFGPLPLKTGKEKYTVPVIQVGAFSMEEATSWLSDYPNVNKAAGEFWDELEHPRSRESGRFVHADSAAGGPPSGPDPRLARARRRRRRARRALADVSYASPAGGLEDVRRERARPERVVAVKPMLTRQATAAVKAALPEAPKNAKVVLTAKGSPKQVAATHKVMDRNYLFAKEALARAKAGTATKDDNLFLSRAFLSGTRRAMEPIAMKPIYSPRGEFIEVIRDPEHDPARHLKTALSPKEIKQAERQLKASLELLQMQKEAGATGWRMDLEPVPREDVEVTEDTLVSIPSETLSWVMPISQGIDLLNDELPGMAVPESDGGFGAKTMRMGRWKDIEGRAAYHQARMDEYETFQRMLRTLGSTAANKYFTEQEQSEMPDRALTATETANLQAELARRMGFPLAAERIEFKEERRQQIVADMEARSDPRVKAEHEESLQRVRDRWKKQQEERRRLVNEPGPKGVDRLRMDRSVNTADTLDNEDLLDVANEVRAAQLREAGGVEDETEKWLLQNDPSHRTRKRTGETS